MPSDDNEDEYLDPGVAWDASRTFLYCYCLEHVRANANNALGELADTVKAHQAPTSEQVHAAQCALDEAQHLLDEYYEPLSTE